MNQSKTPLFPICPIRPNFLIFLRKGSQPEPRIDSGCWCEGWPPEPAYGQVVATILMD